MSTTTRIRKPLATFAALTTALAVGGAVPNMSRAQESQTQVAPAGLESAFMMDPTLAGPCSAEPAESTTDMTLVEGRGASALVRSAFAAIRSGEVVVHSPQGALSQGRIKAYTLEFEEGTFKSVTIPVGGDYSFLSNVTVLFSENGDIARYSEMLVSENSAHNFNVATYTDGILVNSRDTGLAFMTDSELQDSDATVGGHIGPGSGVNDAVFAAAGFWSTVACVGSVLGVSGAVAYLIVGACTGACAIPGVGTAVCIACIGAYATVGGASIAAVASCFR